LWRERPETATVVASTIVPRRGRVIGRFVRAVVLAGALSVVALIAGWVVVEVRRQPWVVHRVMPDRRGGHPRERDSGRLSHARLRLSGGWRWACLRASTARARAARLPGSGTTAELLAAGIDATYIASAAAALIDE